ncbi:hypothetical protein OC842_005923 [Tilletia horrida]|uniref:Uncharacterized protein n=1 Tax=Tilletia horrida TaxID=155126 RepID=A0AAN6G6H3_9BASI|nr:hypothetical protein OC842_005923 [Tilletia horrida]
MALSFPPHTSAQDPVGSAIEVLMYLAEDAVRQNPSMGHLLQHAVQDLESSARANKVYNANDLLVFARNIYEDMQSGWSSLRACAKHSQDFSNDDYTVTWEGDLKGPMTWQQLLTFYPQDGFFIEEPQFAPPHIEPPQLAGQVTTDLEGPPTFESILALLGPDEPFVEGQQFVMPYIAPPQGAGAWTPQEQELPSDVSTSPGPPAHLSSATLGLSTALQMAISSAGTMQAPALTANDASGYNGSLFDIAYDERSLGASLSALPGVWVAPFSIVFVNMMRTIGPIRVGMLYNKLDKMEKDGNEWSCFFHYYKMHRTTTKAGRRISYKMLSDVTPDVCLMLSYDDNGMAVVGLANFEFPFYGFPQETMGWDFQRNVLVYS